jgi:hypothetical protein
MEQITLEINGKSVQAAKGAPSCKLRKQPGSRFPLFATMTDSNPTEPAACAWWRS